MKVRGSGKGKLKVNRQRTRAKVMGGGSSGRKRGKWKAGVKR